MDQGQPSHNVGSGQGYQPDYKSGVSSPPQTSAQPYTPTPSWGMGQNPQGSAFAVPAAPLPFAGYGNESNQLTPGQASQSDQPVPVVKVLSVRGVENVMMILNLWIADAAFLWVALAMINGQSGFSILAFPIATLIVCLPLFAFFFIRLKRAELANPALRFDPSKRRITQITQIFTYFVCVSNVIGFVYELLAKVGGGQGMSIGKSFLNMLAILIIVGGVLAYYWNDEHRTRR